jgi:glutamate 5-kinase
MRTARDAVAAAQRVVVKLGTNVVLDHEGAPATARLAGIVESIARLCAGGRETVLVTSGAVGLGATRLGEASAERRQACAAIGQGRLMAFYHAAFERHALVPAQLLLTERDFSDAARASQVGETLVSLLAFGAVPIVNENDAAYCAERDAAHVVPSAGIPAFRDNDMLAALVAAQVGASLLVLLSDVDGVYTADPRDTPGASLLPRLEHDAVDDAITDTRALPTSEWRTGCAERRGRGGMTAKLAAARHAAAAGVSVVIANGCVAGIVDRVTSGESLGTLVAPRAMQGALS